MARRRGSDEIAFGSDSFLDIVANIVGILIILIVVAGVRVSQMPAVVATAPTDEASVVAVVPPVLSMESVSSEPEVETKLQFMPAPIETPQPTPPAEPIKPSANLLARLEQAQADIARLRKSREAITNELTTTQDDAQSIRSRVEQTRQALASEQQVTTKGRQAIASLQTDVETGQRDIAGLHLSLAEVEALKTPPQVLKHKLTPLGKTVNGKELHFLMSRGGVAVVPVEELAAELKEELLRNKTQLIRGKTRVGSIGPTKGFKMEYLAERDAVSLADELRMGTAVVRVGVSQWRMLPQQNAVFESADEALRPQSRFISVLRTAGRGATLTFWVYPDSFALHRKLQDFAHDNGFDVAARPLPPGIPITGSNRGSRSIAQ